MATSVVAAATRYVSTGDVISTDASSVMGHGTRMNREGVLVATVCGFVERVNKLVSVRPLNSRYGGEIGDVVVGRVVEVSEDRWKVDIGSRQRSQLLLTSITLPGNALRRRTVDDSLAIRTFFREHDLIVAEVQKVNHDGGVHLHTRAGKYGKLRHGTLVQVRCDLIRRSRTHFQLLSCGVMVVLGVNGYIWITHPDALQSNEEPQPQPQQQQQPADASSASPLDSSSAPASAPVPAPAPAPAFTRDVAWRTKAARVRNSILALSAMFISIYDETIMDVYESSLQMGVPAKALLNPDLLPALTQTALARRQATAAAAAAAAVATTSAASAASAESSAVASMLVD